MKLLEWYNGVIKYEDNAGALKQISDPVKVSDILDKSDKRCDRRSIPFRSAIEEELSYF